MATTPPCPERRRRFKLLVWAQNARRDRRERREPDSVNHDDSCSALDTCEKAVQEAIEAELAEVMISLNGVQLEREMIAKQTATGQATLDASYASLAKQSRRLREAASVARRKGPACRPGLVFWLQLCSDLVDQQQGHCRSESLVVHARLARLFTSFKHSGSVGLTKWELANSHLLVANTLMEESCFELLGNLSSKEIAETHHNFGLAWHACGREHRDVSCRETYFRKSECHLRDAVALASEPHASFSQSICAEMHQDLAALYDDMSSISPSCAEAGAYHLSKAADKFSAAGLLARECRVRLKDGQIKLSREDWEGALLAYTGALTAARHVDATYRRQSRQRAAHLRRVWRASMGTRYFDRVYAGAREAPVAEGQARETHAVLSSESGSAGGETLETAVKRSLYAPPEGRSVDIGGGGLAECGVGVVEALVQLGRFDEALLHAERFMTDCSDDTRALLSAHKALLRGSCSWWARDLEFAPEAGRDVDSSEAGDAEPGHGLLEGGDDASAARLMIEGCTDTDTCVVVLHLHEWRRQGAGCRDADAAAQANASSGGEGVGSGCPGYVWIFKGGTQAHTRATTPDGSPFSTCCAVCIRYSSSESAAIRAAARRFRADCTEFRGSFLGSIEYGVTAVPAAERPGAGRAIAHPRGSSISRHSERAKEEEHRTNAPSSRQSLERSLQEVSEALDIQHKIQPEISRLGECSRLLVVADAVLEGVPFSALPVAGEPWGTHFERGTVTAPSLAFAHICRALAREQRAKQAQLAELAEQAFGGHAVGAGHSPAVPVGDKEVASHIPWHDNGGARNWRVVSVGAAAGAKAVFSGWEARRVLEAFETFAKGGESLSGEACVREDIRWAARRRILLPPCCAAAAGGAGVQRRGQDVQATREVAGEVLGTVVHLACHGREDGGGGFEGEHGGRGRGLQLADREVLRSDCVRGWDLSRCPLAIMSACSSALSSRVLAADEDLRRGVNHVSDGATSPAGSSMKLGLAGAFVCAGCPCVLGTLWEVAGASTVAFMLTFYRVLLSGDRALNAWPPRPQEDADKKGQQFQVAPVELAATRVSVSEALKAAQLWLRDASMADVMALLPARRSAASCGGGRGASGLVQSGGGGLRQRSAMAKGIAAGGGSREQRGRGDARPFASPFYWAGFVVMGEG